MISYIKGVIDSVNEDGVVIESNGIGYFVQASPSTISKLPRGEEVKIYTYTNVKENELSLFGFAASDEIKIFNLLISVTGVGPKSAMSLIAAMSAERITLAIITDDAAALCKAPGIGRKTAQRMILELRDKVNPGMAGDSNTQQSLPVYSGGETQDAVDALIALGYGRSESVKAVMETAAEGMRADQIIRLSLKKLVRT